MAISRKTSTMSILALASGLFLLALLALGIWLWTPDRDRAQLEATYLSTPGDMRQVGPWRLHLRDTGPRDAQAVLFIHGFGSSHHTWEAWALALESKHRIVRFDLPGNGLSDPDPTADYSDERSHQLIVAVMDSLGLAKAGIAGHSIGGRLAWTFAARHPQRVERLVAGHAGWSKNGALSDYKRGRIGRHRHARQAARSGRRAPGRGFLTPP